MNDLDESDDVDRALERYARRTIEQVPELIPLLAEHLDGYGPDVLAHVLFGEISQWARDQAESQANPAAVSQLIKFFASSFSSADVPVQELISVSFLENVSGDARVVAMLPANLLREIP